MAFTYDLSTNRGKLRLRIGDTDSANQIFTDAEIDEFLSTEGDNLNLAAAFGLETMASSAALLAKLEEIGDYKVDSSRMSGALLKAAGVFRERELRTPAYGFAEVASTDAGAIQIILNNLLRNQ